MDESRRAEIAEEEHVRSEARSDHRETQTTTTLLGVVLVLAPLVNLVALGNRSWPFIAWLIIGLVVFTFWCSRHGEAISG